MLPEPFTWWSEGEECSETGEEYAARLEGFCAALDLVIGTPGLDVEQLHADARALVRRVQERQLEDLLACVHAERDARESNDDGRAGLRLVPRGGDRS